MAQIALVADEHDDDVVVGVIAQLLQPPFNVLVRQMLCYVVHQQCPDRPTVVPEHNGSDALLCRTPAVLQRLHDSTCTAEGCHGSEISNLYVYIHPIVFVTYYNKPQQYS